MGERQNIFKGKKIIQENPVAFLKCIFGIILTWMIMSVHRHFYGRWLERRTETKYNTPHTVMKHLGDKSYQHLTSW